MNPEQKKKTPAKRRRRLPVDPVEKKLKADAAELRKMHKETSKRLRGERGDGVPVRSVLQAAIEKHQNRLLQLETHVQRDKDLAKRRKQEIDEWKTWYRALPEAEQPTGLEKLHGEIAWRSAELAELTAEISAGVVELSTITGELALAQHRLAAFDAGHHRLPLEEDSRLVHLKSAHKAAKAKLKAHRAIIHVAHMDA